MTVREGVRDLHVVNHMNSLAFGMRWAEGFT